MRNTTIIKGLLIDLFDLGKWSRRGERRVDKECYRRRRDRSAVEGSGGGWPRGPPGRVGLPPGTGPDS